jgi:hypothetical protein
MWAWNAAWPGCLCALHSAPTCCNGPVQKTDCRQHACMLAIITKKAPYVGMQTCVRMAENAGVCVKPWHGGAAVLSTVWHVGGNGVLIALMYVWPCWSNPNMHVYELVQVHGASMMLTPLHYWLMFVHGCMSLHSMHCRRASHVVLQILTADCTLSLCLTVHAELRQSWILMQYYSFFNCQRCY